MFYKKWPYWFRGGIISIIIAIIAVFLFLNIAGINFLKFKFIITILTLLPAMIFGYETCFMVGNPNCRENIPEFFQVFGWLILMLIAFLPGAIVGLIYGKIKSKK